MASSLEYENHRYEIVDGSVARVFHVNRLSHSQTLGSTVIIKVLNDTDADTFHQIPLISLTFSDVLRRAKNNS
jgi:hypothetical protein